MTTAPERGGGAQQDKMKPSRLAPEGFEKKSNSCDPVHSAPNAQNQEPPKVERRPPPYILIPARIRRQEISRLLRYRFDGPCLTDDAEAWFEEIAIHLMISCRSRALRFVADEWVRMYTPRLTDDRVTEILAKFQVARPFYTSADIGRRRCLTYEEKVLLGITHIAAFDIDPVEAAERKKATERGRVNASRLASGKVKKPRSMSLARRVPRLPGENNVRFYERAKALVAGGLA